MEMDVRNDQPDFLVVVEVTNVVMMNITTALRPRNQWGSSVTNPFLEGP